MYGKTVISSFLDPNDLKKAKLGLLYRRTDRVFRHKTKTHFIFSTLSLKIPHEMQSQVRQELKTVIG